MARTRAAPILQRVAQVSLRRMELTHGSFCSNLQLFSSDFKLRLRDWQQVPPEPFQTLLFRCPGLCDCTPDLPSFMGLTDAKPGASDTFLSPGTCLKDSKRSVFVLLRAVEKEFFQAK